MVKGWRLARTGPALLGVLVGCAHGDRDRGACCGPLPVDAPALAVPPEGARGAVVPDVSQLPPFTALDESLRRARNSPVPYRHLDARDCQCLAVRASNVANLLDGKAGHCLAQGGGRGPCRDEVGGAATVQQGMLRDAALEARNRSAGAALELFFRLAEAEGKFDVLRASLAEIDEALAAGESMKAKGMELGDDFEILRRRRVAALDSHIELELAIDRLNVELRHLVKLGPVDQPWRIWPVASWMVVAEPSDVEAAVALGLGRRPELALLGKLAQSVDRENAELVRGVLGEVNALLGLSCQGTLTKGRILLTFLGHSDASDEEVQALCRQLQAYRLEREQAVADEVRQAVLTVGARLSQVAVAREEEQGWERRIDELKAKAERGMSTFPERATVELRRLEARASLIEKVMAWHIARVKLAQAQGILIDGCGPTACPVLPAAP